MNKELTLEETENIVDNMYQNRWKECGVEDGNTIHMGNLDNLQYNELESASILLLRTEIRLQQEIKKLQRENEKNKHYKTLYQSLKRQKEELRSWLEEGKRVSIAHENMKSVNFISLVLSKLEELEGVSNEKDNSN